MNEVQRQYQKQLSRILRLKVSKNIKIQMLEGLQQVLKQHCKIQSIVFNQSFNQISIVKPNQKFHEVESTKFSQSLSIQNVTLISKRDIEELEEQILNKKILKIQIFQIFEAIEDEFYALEDQVEYKRKYNQNLRKEIDKKMIAIEEQKQKSMEVSRSPSIEKSNTKHNKSFSDYFISWWQ